MSSINRNIFCLSIVLFQIFFSTADATTELCGTLKTMTISSDGNPIVVKENITIPADSHAVIQKGCKLFFKSSAGIIIEGSLSIEGTKDEPVIFTSIYDSFSPEKSEQKANPFDWNGILITKQAKNITMTNFIIKYSVYGIESYNPNMTIENGIFIGNGQFNCTLNNKIMPVDENISYSYKNEKQGNAPKKDRIDMAKFLLPSSKAAAVTGVAALCFMTYYLHQKSEYVSLYRATQSQAMRKEYYEDQKPLARSAIICGITGGVLLSAGGVLLVLDRNWKKGKTISLSPIIGRENGILAMIEF
jgi:hypothetical protein